MDTAQYEYLLDLLAEYYNNPVALVHDILGATPTEQQKEALMAVVPESSRVTIRSGHGTGKTTVLSWLIIWFLLTRKGKTRIPCTAPTASQLETILWSEVKSWIDQIHPIFKGVLQYNADHVWVKDYKSFRFAVAKTARKENPEALAGQHAENMLFIIDEASGVPEAIFETGEGAMSTMGARVIMTSNPTRTEGYFFRSHNDESGYWTPLHFSCMKSPLVDMNWVNMMKERYGEDSSVFKVRVLGDFPLGSDDTIIPLSWLTDSVGRNIQPDSSRRIAGLDIARFGDDSNGLVIRQGNLVKFIDKWSNMDLMQTAGRVFEYWKDGLFDIIYVDVIGLGAGVADRLHELGVPVVTVNVAEGSAYSTKYSRLRDELWWEAREFFQEKIGSLDPELFKITTGKSNILEDFIAELATVRYGYTAQDKLKVESKADMKKRGIASPDLADAFCLTFYKGRRHVGKIKARQIKVTRSIGWT